MLKEKGVEMKIKKLLFLTVFFCTGVLTQAQVKLSFNPAKGETYSYRFDIEQAGTQTFMGQEIPINTTIGMLLEMNIKEKNKDEVRVNYTYKEIVMTVSIPMMNIHYDSKNPVEKLSEQEQLIAQIFNSLIGKTMNVVISSNGSVKSISGFKAIMEEMQKNMDSSVSQQMAGTLLQSFNDEAMKNMFEQSFRFYPNSAVKISDSWNSDFSYVVMGMNNDIKNTYTLKSIKNNVAALDVVSILTLKPNAGMEGEISGEQKGEISLNVQTGMLVNSNTTQNIKGKLNIQGSEMWMDLVSKTTVSLE